jgi:hypothetical protein
MKLNAGDVVTVRYQSRTAQVELVEDYNSDKQHSFRAKVVSEPVHEFAEGATMEFPARETTLVEIPSTAVAPPPPPPPAPKKKRRES